MYKSSKDTGSYSSCHKSRVVFEIDDIPSKKSSAQVDVWVNSVLTRNGFIKCYKSLFKEIILQQCDPFQTGIQDSLMKPCAFKASRGHPSKMVKLPIIPPGAKTWST